LAHHGGASKPWPPFINISNIVFVTRGRTAEVVGWQTSGFNSEAGGRVCGRYYRRSDKQRFAEAFHLGTLDDMPSEAAPSYNIAPTTMQPVTTPLLTATFVRLVHPVAQ